MKQAAIVVSLMLAITVTACAPDRGDASKQSKDSEEATKRKDPVRGVANNLGGVKRGSDSGFGRAADMTQ